MNIFVGNLLFEATEADVKKLFAGFGNVASVAIVMKKGKKAPQSRGFGFVQMPDEQQALAAIAAFNGKEFMGRLLNVNPARPKTEVQVFNKHLAFPDHNVRNESGSRQRLLYGREKEGQVRPFGQPGTYKGGRRTRSYMKRRGLDGIPEETRPRQRSQDNPMRWRKREDKPRPWQKSPGEHKPWGKVAGGARPWKKAEGESKPWRKSGGSIKPWKKPAGDAKPWSKSSRRPQKSGNGERPSTTLRTALSERSKSNGHSRTKGRRKPGGYKR